MYTCYWTVYIPRVQIVLNLLDRKTWSCWWNVRSSIHIYNCQLNNIQSGLYNKCNYFFVKFNSYHVLVTNCFPKLVGKSQISFILSYSYTCISYKNQSGSHCLFIFLLLSGFYVRIHFNQTK